ncbi:hypothetical protein [Dyadobacter sp. MSC1_007]|jgi:hypothetical protein|uniref:hypothetical protein n=1 Tax=Dyadobacter sp. MSC1_007 TaxID=2909264 RepID=UPI00202FF169|nr:hypothetical protein [Dyadobacter sp. MSC1_007]
MKKPLIIVDVVKEDVGYSAVFSEGDIFIGTQGDDFEELKNNILEAVNLAYLDKGFSFQMEEIQLRPDLIESY